MIFLVILLVLALAAMFVLVIRAHREHTDALTNMHGDLAASWRDVRKVVLAAEAKIDGGTIPK
jgi:hypothetical protein